jgi:AcrR family transcriptional regulator
MRRELLDAAAAIIETDGIDALTVQSVTKAATCAKGVLYSYFDDLDDLVAELVTQTLTVTINELRALIDAAPNKPFLAVLESIGLLIVGEANMRIAAAAFQRPGVVERVGQRFAGNEVPNLETLMVLIASYLENEKRHGHLDPNADITTLTYLFVTALHDQLQQGRNSPQLPNTKQLVAVLFKPIIGQPQRVTTINSKTTKSRTNQLKR